MPNFGNLMPEGFGMLTSLKELSLCYCEALGSLPESESPMTSHFLISNFGNLMSEGFGQLASLADLHMAWCHALAKNEGTYAILSKISTLTKLTLAWCNMESLPEGSP